MIVEENLPMIRETGHMQRVAHLSLEIARLMDLSEKIQNNIYIAALNHDVGKASIDLKIVEKPGKLNFNEMYQMQLHVFHSAVEAIMKGYDKEIVETIFSHHENYDGSGYLRGISGDEIPLGARIIRITDSYDALTMDRPYRKKLTSVEAIQVMKNESQFYDPDIFILFKNFIL